MAKLSVRMEPIGSIKPHPGNPRRNHDVEGIARSINAFGFRQPLVIWDGDGHVLAGHGRLLAAKHLGLDTVPVHYVGADELTAAQAAAYRLADNRSAEGSQWDDALLLAELALLDAREREAAGFDAAYLEEVQRRLSPEPPDEFREYDEGIDVEHVCPKCGYAFSGNTVSRQRTGDGADPDQAEHG